MDEKLFRDVQLARIGAWIFTYVCISLKLALVLTHCAAFHERQDLFPCSFIWIKE